MENKEPQIILPTEIKISESEHKPERKMWRRIGLTIVVLFIILAGFGLARFYMQEKAITNLSETGSDEYKTYVEAIDKISDQWLVIKDQMEAKNSSQEDIILAEKDFINSLGSTILLKIQFESSLSDIEQEAIARKLQKLVTDDKKSSFIADKTCEYSEEQLPLQDFFVGATLKFKKPMVYLEDDNEKGCSPNMIKAHYTLWSVESWNSILFDKSKIIEHPVSPETTFVVAGRLLVKRGGLFANETEHYILRDSNGKISVPSSDIFDQDFRGKIGESGSELYNEDAYVGHIVSDVTSGGVWIQGTQVPKEVVEANTLKLRTSFESTLSKRDEFMRRIMFAIDEGKIVDYTNEELMENDVAQDLYTSENGEVINNFGGKVYLKKDGDVVSVVFDKIPKGEECYQFYYINDPKIYGFKESYIDGTLEVYDFSGSKSWNPIISAFKQKVCYSGKETVTIEFKGTINDIKKQARFMREMKKPRY
jgi:hypothetical protein